MAAPEPIIQAHIEGSRESASPASGVASMLLQLCGPMAVLWLYGPDGSAPPPDFESTHAFVSEADEIDHHLRTVDLMTTLVVIDGFTSLDFQGSTSGATLGRLTACCPSLLTTGYTPNALKEIA